jgi:DNA modification methylase
MNIHCRYDELVNISDLKAHPKNRNSHPKEQIERLAKILVYQGWRYPVKVSKRSGLVTSGHGRIEAARLNGWAQVPVNYQDYESEDQEYADLTADNAIASWSELDLSGINSDLAELGPFDIDLLGIEDFVLEPLEKIPQADEDSIPEHVEPKTKLGDVYKLGEHRLMCGDSTAIDAVEKLMNGKKAELCFTSPPYADQREYNGGKELSTEHLATFIRAAFNSVKYFAVNLGYSRKGGEVVTYWDDYIKEAKDCRFKLLSWNVWDRGHAFSIGQMTAMFPIEHEWIFIFGEKEKDLNLTVENKTGGTVNNHRGTRQSDGSVKKQKDMQIRSHRPIGTVTRQAPQMGRDGFDHPARFPVDLPEKYIEAMTDTSDAVYEPFGGSGSTLIACEKTNRKCFMMELDTHYCDVIVARWEKYTGQKAELLTGEVI